MYRGWKTSWGSCPIRSESDCKLSERCMGQKQKKNSRAKQKWTLHTSYRYILMLTRCWCSISDFLFKIFDDPGWASVNGQKVQRVMWMSVSECDLLGFFNHIYFNIIYQLFFDTSGKNKIKEIFDTKLIFWGLNHK